MRKRIILNYELRITNYELRITNYELRITNYELRIEDLFAFTKLYMNSQKN